MGGGGVMLQPPLYTFYIIIVESHIIPHPPPPLPASSFFKKADCQYNILYKHQNLLENLRSTSLYYVKTSKFFWGSVPLDPSRCLYAHVFEAWAPSVCKAFTTLCKGSPSICGSRGKQLLSYSWSPLPTIMYVHEALISLITSTKGSKFGVLLILT